MTNQSGETGRVWFHGEWALDRRMRSRGRPLLWQEVPNDGTDDGVRRWMTVVEEGRRSVEAAGYRLTQSGGDDRGDAA